MKTHATLLILFLIATASFGQMEFEKGYLITSDSQRKECLIKNEEWKDNPTEFTYKLSKSASPETGDLKSVKEFSIFNTCKYVNANVKADLQTKPAISAKNEVIPVWTREIVFLKVLLEGKANLYSYDINKVKRFFYSLNDTSVIQLTYLEALDGFTLIKNTSYHQQLWSGIKAPNATMNSIKAITYTEKDLTTYFREYNSSFGGSSTELAKAKRKPYINLKLTPGLNSSKVSMQTVADDKNIKYASDFSNSLSFRIGLESELIIPFNQYHWGILFEPTFQSYQSEAESESTYGLSTIKSSSVEFPIGLRYYFHASENIRFFLNGLVIPGFAMNMNSQIEFYRKFANKIDPYQVDIKSSGSAAFGGGVEFNRLSLETRYYTNRNLLNGLSIGSADYSRFSVVLGYKFMKTRFK